MLGQIERISYFTLTVFFCSCATTKPDPADLSSSDVHLEDVGSKDTHEQEVSTESPGKQGKSNDLLVSEDPDALLEYSVEEDIQDSHIVKNDDQDSPSIDAKHGLPSDDLTVRSSEGPETEPLGDGLKPDPISSRDATSLASKTPSVENNSGFDAEIVISNPSQISATPEAGSPTESVALGDSADSGRNPAVSKVLPTSDSEKEEGPIDDLQLNALPGEGKAPADPESGAGSVNPEDPIIGLEPEASAEQESGKEDLPLDSALSKENTVDPDLDASGTSRALGSSDNDSSNPETQLPENTTQPVVGVGRPERDTSLSADRNRFRFSSPRSFLRQSGGKSEEDGLSLGFSSRRQNLNEESGSVSTRRYLHLNDWIGKGSGREPSEKGLYLGSSEPTDEPQLKTYIDESPLVGLSESVPWEYDSIAEVLKSREPPTGKRIDHDYDYDSLRKFFSSENAISLKNGEALLSQSDYRDYESLLRWLDSRKGLSRPRGDHKLPKRKYSGVLRWLKNEGRED